MKGDVLFQKAFERAKSRFLNFLIVTVLGWGLGLAVILGFGISLGVTLAVWAFVKAPPVVGIVAAVMGLFSVGLFAYLSSWAQLATVDSLIQTKKVGPFETYKRVRPYVKTYIGFFFLLMFFMIGLLPFTVLSIFIVGLLWTLWSSFSVFVLLEKKKKGLDNLWMSQQMVNQRFWPIAGLAFVVAVVVLLLSFLLISLKSGFASSLVSQLLIAPFVTSFYYEIYKTLKVPQEVKKPTGWIMLSVVGFVIMVIVGVLVYQAVSKALPEILKKNDPQNNEFYKELLYPSSPDEVI